ncbi:hypothetical protein HanPSC8_Chr14g0604081 [Helianthus annuus]|nr:hypothetical protein HanPSC8_Chr14g0604081 [Helianthus annuus]
MYVCYSMPLNDYSEMVGVQNVKGFGDETSFKGGRLVTPQIFYKRLFECLNVLND